MKLPHTKLICAITACFAMSSCFVSKNKLPDSEKISDNKILGEYYEEDSKGVRTDRTIRKSKDAAFDYEEVLSDGNAFGLNLYKIGSLRLAFHQRPWGEDGSTRYVVSRYSVTKTQIVFDQINPAFFKRNPEALPNTKIVNEGDQEGVSTEASPEQLKAFFTLQETNSGLFSSEGAKIYNKIKN